MEDLIEAAEGEEVAVSVVVDNVEEVPHSVADVEAIEKEILTVNSNAL